VLTFPIMVIKVNTIEDTVQWRWLNALYVGVGSFFLSAVWMYMMERRNRANRRRPIPEASSQRTVGERIRAVFQAQRNRNIATAILLAAAVIYPFVTSMYQTNIMISALMFVVLALGLNIIIGLGGMLMLGYIAFYAVGAYSYALLNLHFGLNFWLAIPVGAALGGLAGVLVAIPTMHLRGDYLAIVTLGFGEIVRIVLENWNEFSQGPSGIANIPRPGFFGIDMGLSVVTVYIYFIVLALVLFTILVVYRLEHSRIGRQWEAMKEDAVASQAMGVNVARSKLSAIALGAVWAGMMGVVFAARTTFINPASFTVWESIIVLSAVVLGGMGSIPGAILGALIIILVPEYLRAFADYRLMLFGAVLVTMMVFRPGGIIQKRRKAYQFQAGEGGAS
jgi:branched-chain amino acid transport system permease protein